MRSNGVVTDALNWARQQPLNAYEYKIAVKVYPENIQHDQNET